VWTLLRSSSTYGFTLGICLLALGCSRAPAPAHAGESQLAVVDAVPDCWRDSLHPSAAPPAQGMWTNEGAPEAARVAALIGPPEMRAGSTVVTRAIETIERPDSQAQLRARLDDAVVRLELVPRFAGGKRESARSSGDELEPAGVYAVTPQVSLVSYEACAGLSAVRYLRRDAHGGIASDAMLRKVATQR